MTSYIFGRFVGSYTQYPDDGQVDVFHHIVANAKAKTQVAIHRDGNLMYYCYLRKFEVDKYIGFCVLLNGTYVENVFQVFRVFEDLITKITYRGNILYFDEKGNLTSNLHQLYKHAEEINLVDVELQTAFSELIKRQPPLPPTDFSVASHTSTTYSVEDDLKEVLHSSLTFGYTYILKENDFNTQKMNAYRSTLKRLSRDNEGLKEKCQKISHELMTERTKRRNIVWVGLLGMIVVIMGIILYYKVLFPTEVTHYETGEFVYYGPIEDGKPNGVGVAIYPVNDKDGRKYYIGNFTKGERQDSAAILFYQDGDYYYGSMEGDRWDHGMLYMNSDNSHFVGTFQDNNPYTGKWYDHINSQKSYLLYEGKKANGIKHSPKKSEIKVHSAMSDRESKLEKLHNEKHRLWEER